MDESIKKIALLGMGTVGGGVYEILAKQKPNMPAKLDLHWKLQKFW